MKFGRYEVEITNRDKILFPESGLTKGDLIDYYLAVAETLIPHMAHYGMSMQRFPDGIDEEGFYQKDAADYFPDWLTTVRIPKRQGGSFAAPVVTCRATLAYLANQAVVTPHLYLARSDDLEHPDRMIFDLDPPAVNGNPEDVCRAALALRDLLAELDLNSWVQTTGSKGFHLVVPLVRCADFDEVRAFAGAAARLMVRRHPQRYTQAQRKRKRGQRIFIDTQRNTYGATAVCPYGVRARAGAPVATPVTWQEVEASVSPRAWRLQTIPRRLQEIGDPWAGLHRHARQLGGRKEILETLLGNEKPADEESS
ncbi:MAG: non-homologous end-joining DNA ligase [Desulfuromonadales bacterium]|jgi:bifunctional non-homologous end joining protein LigD